MAIINVTSGGDTGNTDTYTTASITLTPGKLYLISVMNSRGSGVGTVAVTGCGLTWDHVGAPEPVTWNSDQRKISILRATGTPTTGSLTITMSIAGSGALWSVDEIDTNVLTNNGADAVKQVAINSTGSGFSSLTVTLGAFANSGNAVYGAFGQLNQEDLTPGSGFTQLADNNIASPSSSFLTMYRIGQDTSVDASSVGTSQWGGVAIEVDVTTGSGSTPISGTDADTLVGSDSASLAAATTTADSDTLAGSDAAAIEAALAVSDSDTLNGSDSASVSVEGGDATPSVSDADTLAGSETLTLEVAAAAADADTLSGVDAGAIEATLSVADSDPLTGADAASVEISGGDASPSVGDTDTLVGIDLASVAVTLTVADADTLVGIDAAAVLTGDTLLRSRAINRRSAVLSVADQRALTVDIATSEARSMSAHTRALTVGVTDRRPLTIDLEG